MASPRIRRRLLLGAVALVLPLTGCFKMELKAEVDSEGRISGEYIAAIAEEAIDSLGDLGGEDALDDPAQALEDAFGAIPDGADVSFDGYDEDGFVGVKVTFEDLPVEDLSRLFVDSSGVPSGSLRITVTDDRVRLTGSFPFAASASLGALGALGGGSGDNPLGDLMEDAEATVTITFPGKVLEHNGELDGTTVRWELDTSADNELMAVSEATGGASGGDSFGDGGDDDSSVVGPIVAAVLVAAIIVGVVLFLRSRGKGKGTPTAPTPAPTPAADVPVGAPTLPPPGGLTPPTPQAPPTPPVPPAPQTPPTPPTPGSGAPLPPPPPPD